MVIGNRKFSFSYGADPYRGIISLGMDLSFPDHDDWFSSHYVLTIRIIKYVFSFQVYKNESL